MTPRTASTQPPQLAERLPSRTFRLREEEGRMAGMADGLDAVRQAVRLILSVERYAWLIHSWNYGVELADLFGKPLSYALPEVERRITEALLQDDRITAVHDFTFTKGRGGRVTAAFTVESVFGSLHEDREVEL